MTTDTRPTDPTAQDSSGDSLAETDLKLGGKSAEVARRSGGIDHAEDNDEELFKRH